MFWFFSMTTWFPSYSTLRIFLDGMLCMMIVYALLSYVQQRKSIYWKYALYIVCMLITFRLNDNDYSSANYAPGANYAVALIESIAFILYIRFAILLINIPAHDSISHRLLQFMTLVLLGGAILDTCLWIGGLSDELRSGLYTINRFVLAGMALMVVPRIVRLRKPVISYFITGSSFFVTGCILALCLNYVPALFTREPGNPFTFPVLYIQVGVVLEVLCFTLGLSRLNLQTESEKQFVQAQLIEQLRENERKQEKLQRIRDDIARDLHDELGADLGGIGMLALSASRQVMSRPDEVGSKLVLISQSSRRVVATMREIIWNLNSAHDTLQNMASRLEETARTHLTRQGIDLHMELPPCGTDGPLPAEYRRDLFLLFKEALHNLIRHSGAAQAFIRLSVEEAGSIKTIITLAVHDNGRGFDPSAVGLGGNGLRSMHQRAASLDGTLQITASIGVGTTLIFRGLVEGITHRSVVASELLTETLS